MPQSKSISRLSELEPSIQRLKDAWLEASEALREADELYKELGYTSFDSYCRERWGWQRQRAYELIASGDAVKELPPECNFKITNATQALELSKSAPHRRVEVLEHAAASGPITAKSIRESRAVIDPGSEPVKPPSQEAIEADKESDSLFQLKRWWKKAGKSDRKKFLRWVKLAGAQN